MSVLCPTSRRRKRVSQKPPLLRRGGERRSLHQRQAAVPAGAGGHGDGAEDSCGDSGAGHRCWAARSGGHGVDTGALRAPADGPRARASSEPCRPPPALTALPPEPPSGDPQGEHPETAPRERRLLHAARVCAPCPLPAASPKALPARLAGWQLVKTVMMPSLSLSLCTHRKSPFSRLVYPMPEDGGLGTHATLDLAGGCRFGCASTRHPPLPPSMVHVDAR